MTWFSIFIFAIRYAPDVVKSIEAILDLLRKLPGEFGAKAKEDLGNAVITGNPDVLRNTVGEVHARCTVACPLEPLAP